jgi:hypothetical protein
MLKYGAKRGFVSMNAELKDLEVSLWQSKTRFDRTYMEHVLAPDFFEFGRSGRRWTRDECLEVTGKVEINVKLPLEAFNTHLIDDMTVLVTYITEARYDTVERSNRSSLWSKTGEGWRLRFHQGTPTD